MSGLAVAQDLARLLVSDSPAAVRGQIDAAVDDGIDPRALCVDLLTPALYEVGRMWQTGEVTIAQEHLATAVAQIEIARLSPRMRRLPAVGRLAVLAGSPAELHTLGLVILRYLLEGDGWCVLDLGQSTPAGDLARLVDDRRPDVVGLSTSLTTHMEGARETFAALSSLPRRPLLIAGGQAWGGDEGLAVALGADVFVPDALSAADFLRSRFAGG